MGRIHILAASLLLASNLAVAQSNTGAVQTGEDLYTALKRLVEYEDHGTANFTAVNSAQTGWASGYIVGVRDGMATGMLASGRDARCFDDHMSTVALARITLKVIEDRPELRGKPAYTSALTAVMVAYPCTTNKMNKT